MKSLNQAANGKYKTVQATMLNLSIGDTVNRVGVTGVFTVSEIVIDRVRFYETGTLHEHIKYCKKIV